MLADLLKDFVEIFISLLFVVVLFASVVVRFTLILCQYIAKKIYTKFKMRMKEKY